MSGLPILLVNKHMFALCPQGWTRESDPPWIGVLNSGELYCGSWEPILILCKNSNYSYLLGLLSSHRIPFIESTAFIYPAVSFFSWGVPSRAPTEMCFRCPHATSTSISTIHASLGISSFSLYLALIASVSLQFSMLFKKDLIHLIMYGEDRIDSWIP